jgi:uncharacterized Zn finger protein
MPTPQPPGRPTPNPHYKPAIIKPRKVSGGLRLLTGTPREPSREAPGTLDHASGVGSPLFNWAGQRWLRLFEQQASGAALAEGLDYARIGQTRRLDIFPGRIVANVQGRSVRAYDTSIHVRPFSPEQAESLINAMGNEAIHAAKLLLGEMPSNIEDLMAPLGLRLFPTEAAELRIVCTCRETEQRPWCKHACCVGYLISERLSSDPFVMFTLRGLPKEDLLERLRQRRTLLGVGLGSVPIYAPTVPGVSDAQVPALEAMIEQYWDSHEATTEGLDLPIAPPPISHPLLRRLGPSPFAPPQGTAKFPLVGLLATCYDVISQGAIRDAVAEVPLSELSTPRSPESMSDDGMDDAMDSAPPVIEDEHSADEPA